MQLFYIFLLLISKLESIYEPENAIRIEVNTGNSKPISVFIVSTADLKNFKDSLQYNLEKCKRFKVIQNKSKSSYNIIIKKEFIDDQEKTSIEVFDVQENRAIKKFFVKNIQPENFLKICDLIYKILTHEEGIFRNKLILAIASEPNKCELFSIKSNLTDFKKICDEKINNLQDLFLCDNKIFLCKFTKEDKAFSIMFFDPIDKNFYNVFTIKSASVYAPAVYDREIYIAVTDHDTTGIFKQPFTGSKTYNSFEDFLKDPTVTTVTSIKGKIATAPTANQGKIAFCADYEGAPSIYLYPNRKISSSEGSYFDPALKDSSLAAIKIYKGEFYLVLINLKNGIEKTLVKKYFIARPTWSPCGNWIAVSCRDKGKKDVILLVHKTGKYIMTIQTNHKIKNIIWMKEDN
ncbi:hypothetical protein [Alphaproteobacteria bacterium endosymbiont of Tiliacea citrago]|uniref:TolB family protein n=1 Tax=Alphaproteobacteria bacterium endosymbiont of Tiliacea citrago TaxID=3077944 RepID=UPI00313D53F5